MTQPGRAARAGKARRLRSSLGPDIRAKRARMSQEATWRAAGRTPRVQDHPHGFGVAA